MGGRGRIEASSSASSGFERDQIETDFLVDASPSMSSSPSSDISFDIPLGISWLTWKPLSSTDGARDARCIVVCSSLRLVARWPPDASPLPPAETRLVLTVPASLRWNQLIMGLLDLCLTFRFFPLPCACEGELVASAVGMAGV